MINPIQMAACYTIVPLPLVLSSRRRKTEDWRAETDSWLPTTKPDLLIQVDIHLVGITALQDLMHLGRGPRLENVFLDVAMQPTDLGDRRQDL